MRSSCRPTSVSETSVHRCASRCIVVHQREVPHVTFSTQSSLGAPGGDDLVVLLRHWRDGWTLSGRVGLMIIKVTGSFTCRGALFCLGDVSTDVPAGSSDLQEGAKGKRKIK